MNDKRYIGTVARRRWFGFTVELLPHSRNQAMIELLKKDEADAKLRRKHTLSDLSERREVPSDPGIRPATR